MSNSKTHILPAFGITLTTRQINELNRVRNDHSYGDLTPQARIVLDHMIVSGSTTNVEANAVLRVRSLSRRITEIMDTIFNTVIISKEQKRDSTGQRYVRYSLSMAPRWN